MKVHFSADFCCVKSCHGEQKLAYPTAYVSATANYDDPRLEVPTWVCWSAQTTIRRTVATSQEGGEKTGGGGGRVLAVWLI